MPIKKICKKCGKEYLVKPYMAANSKFCSYKCRRIGDVPMTRAQLSKGHRDKHPDAQRKASQRWQRNLAVLWGGGKYYNQSDPLVIASEEFIAKHVLPKEGFTEIILTRGFSAYFPCDILCKKDGKICLIEVTLGVERKINKRLDPVLKFLSATAFVCHVKPDLSKYYLLELPMDKFYSSAVQPFLASLAAPKELK